MFSRTILLAFCAALAAPADLKQWMEQQRREHSMPFPDWRPVSNAKVQVTDVQRAKFPAIDVHTHIRNPLDRSEVKRIIGVMEAANLRTAVHVTGGSGERLRSVILALNAYPGRFITCATPDWTTINEPDFTARAIRALEQAKRDGARCLKILKVLGLYLKDKNGRFIAVNDPRLDPIWEKCGELGFPVLIHTADPIAFFRPWDEKNEAYAALWQHPDWWFYGKDFEGTPRFTHEELMRQRDDIVARHPRTTFVALHYGSLSHDLAAVGALLDKYPNVVVEMGARNWALGMLPNGGRKFALKYQDRILFGTDGAVDAPALYHQYFRTLETEDDLIFSPLPRSWGPIHGIHLDDTALRKIYSGNAERLFARTRR